MRLPSCFLLLALLATLIFPARSWGQDLAWVPLRQVVLLCSPLTAARHEEQREFSRGLLGDRTDRPKLAPGGLRSVPCYCHPQPAHC